MGYISKKPSRINLLMIWNSKEKLYFISGTGSNLKNLINKSRDYTFPISVNLVVSNNLKAYGLSMLKKFDTYFVNKSYDKLSENFILNELKNRKIHLVVAGYMKIISQDFKSIW